jgi:vacuolar protein sorting-associated protein 35
MVGTLHRTSIFGVENYDALASKLAVLAARLIRRSDQCRGLLTVIHLFWSGGDIAVGGVADAVSEGAEPRRVVRDGQRILKGLQRAIQIADTVIDTGVKAELLVEVLEKMIWFFEKRVDTVRCRWIDEELLTTLWKISQNQIMPKHISDHLRSTSGLISSLPHATRSDGPLFAPAYSPPRTAKRVTSCVFNGPDLTELKKAQESVARHFKGVVGYIAGKKSMGAQGGWGEIDIGQGTDD